MQTVVEVKQLVKQYDALTAVNNVSFSIEKGACFGLLGPNGAGKTTTIEIMEGIISATSGTVLFQGEQVSLSVAEQIGILYQHTALQDFLTVKETLNLFASFYEKTIPNEQLIDLCDLAEFLNKDTRLLSGGQRQRLLLALALVNDPEIVFLDEPTTGLDPQARRNFWQLIKKIKSQNKTVVLTTHYMDEAEQLCDYIVVMDHGEVIEQGKPQILLQRHFGYVFIYLPVDQVPESLITEHGWKVHEGHIEISTTNVEATIGLLLNAHVPLNALHVKSANLDDLFLKLTGHTLRE